MADADAAATDVFPHPRPAQTSSQSSLKPRSSKATLNLYSNHPPPATIRSIVTVPRTLLPFSLSFFRGIFLTLCLSAWARDEPQSPTESVHNAAASCSASRPASRSDILSLTSSSQPKPDKEHRWFPFARRNTFSKFPGVTAAPGSAERTSDDDGNTSLNEANSPHTGASALNTPSDPLAGRFRNWGLRVNLPPQHLPSATLAQSRTPGWESPWVPKINAPMGSRAHSGLSEKDGDLTRWQAFKKGARRYLLHNVYAPLVRASSP
jgi:hypothetical protein